MNTSWNSPALLGDHNEEDMPVYLNRLNHGIKLLGQLNKLPKIRVTHDPIMQWHYSKPVWNLQKIKLFSQNKSVEDDLTIYSSEKPTSIDIELHGNYAIVQNTWMGHYGHNAHDNLGKFEFFRQLFNNKIKFIVTEYEPDRHVTTLQQLYCLNPFYKDNVLFLPPKTTLKINGLLFQAEREPVHWFDESKMYCKYLRIGLNEQVKTDTKTSREHIIFCPRFAETASHGRLNAQESIEKIKQLIESIIKQYDKPIDFSVFTNKNLKGDPMTVQEQKDFFKTATVILGIHGTALTNMMWADRLVDYKSPPLQIIEITGNTTARNKNHPQIEPWQFGNDCGYWHQFGNHFNVNWQHIFFDKIPERKDFTFVDIDMNLLEKAVKNALNQITTGYNNQAALRRGNRK
jgi:hypothetical protein